VTPVRRCGILDRVGVGRVTLQGDRVRVLVVDDHSVVRAGLTQLIDGAPDLEVLAAVAGGEEAIAAVARQPFDVVLMDVSMPGIDGVETTRRLLDAHPDLRVVILTSFADRPVILDALEAGAIGYLLKDAEPEELLRGIRAAARGESPLAPKAAQQLLAARREPAGPAADLTERERQILGCIGEGLPNKLIARRLEIAEKTVKNHVTRILQVLGVSDRTQAALWAHEHGLAV
jgi:DNA-binding NarL/FixJ family response regulator